MIANEYDAHWGDLEKNAESSFANNLIDAIYDFFLLDESTDPMEKIASIIEEDEVLDFISDIEDELEVEFFDQDIDAMCDGTLVEMIEKIAEISSPQERARMKAYYVQNKAQLARKSRKRRRRQKMGVQRKKTRTGPAGGGYSFVLSANSGPSIRTSSSTGASRSSGITSGMPSFDPNKRPSPTYQVNHLART
jgi:hypothetical protein